MMDDFVIFSDSGSDLSPALQEKFGVTVLPLHFRWCDDTENGEGDTMPRNADFYAAMRAGRSGETASVGIGEYEDAFRPVLERGGDILYIGFSSGLSGSVRAAEIAAAGLREEFPARNITVIDSLCASLGLGLLISHAVGMQKEGRSLSETAEWIEKNKLRICHWFTVGDLQYLKRTGRISGAAAMVGGMLGMKPILHTDENGKLVSVGKVRGRAASLRELATVVENRATDLAGQTVFISHADCPADAQTLAGFLREAGARDVLIGEIGPLIGAHCGPETIAVFFMGDVR